MLTIAFHSDRLQVDWPTGYQTTRQVIPDGMKVVIVFDGAKEDADCAESDPESDSSSFGCDANKNPFSRIEMCGPATAECVARAILCDSTNWESHSAAVVKRLAHLRDLGCSRCPRVVFSHPILTGFVGTPDGSSVTECHYTIFISKTGYCHKSLGMDMEMRTPESAQAASAYTATPAATHRAESWIFRFGDAK